MAAPNDAASSLKRETGMPGRSPALVGYYHAVPADLTLVDQFVPTSLVATTIDH
jgi:hypothetical protein